MSLAAGGRALHLPGLSTIKQSEPVEDKPNKKHLVLFAVIAGILALTPLIGLLWAMPEINEQKHLNDMSGPQGDGFFIADLGRDYAYVPLVMCSWFLAFVLETMVYLAFFKISHTTASRYSGKFFGSLFIVFILTASALIAAVSGGYSTTNDQLKDWAKEKYKLSQVGYFDTSSATLEGKDSNDQPVKLNVVHDGNVLYLYENNEQLLKIAQDMVYSKK